MARARRLMALMARNRGEKITAAASWPVRDLGKMVSVLTGGVHLSVEEKKKEDRNGTRALAGPMHACEDDAGPLLG